MFAVSRKCAFVLLAAFALAATGCGSSNNKGKIVGKWQITGGPGMKGEEMKMMEMMKVTPYLEFKDDGTAAFGINADGMFKKLLEEKGDALNVSFKYKLLNGDGVELYDLPKEMQDKKGGGLFGKKDRARANVKIDGDAMSVTDDEELKNSPMTLKRMK